MAEAQDTSAAPAEPIIRAALPGIEADTIWSIETVDGAAGVGNYSSLDIDSLDYLHVGYYDMPNTALKYAQWTGGSWITETVDNSASVGQYASLDLDESNWPYLSYYDLTNTALKVARWDSSSWISDTVDNSAAVGTYTSLAYNPSDGNVHISYHDETNTALKYARWNGSSWISTTVDNNANVGTYSSLALRGTSPRISYHNATSNTLRYAVYQAGPGTWSVSDLTGFDGGGNSTSMAIDSSGYEHISHFQSDGEVRYIYQDLAGWHDGLVEAGCGEFVPTALALDGDDRPHIAYVHGDGTLRYATFDGVGWEIEIVDDSGEAGGDAISLALDGQGYPHITYSGATGLHHAWLHPAPDLVVTDIWDNGGQIWYQVRNIGTDTAPAGHYVSLSIDGVPGGTDTVLAELAPGERYTDRITAWSCGGDDDDLRVTADYGGIIDELDETNNLRREVWNCDTTAPQFIQPPTITLVQPDSVVIEWETDENSNSRVYYGQEADAYPDSESDASNVTAHQVILTGLTQATLYHYRVESTDPSGNTAASDEYFFETAALPSAPLTGTMTIARRNGDYPAYDVTVTVNNSATALGGGSNSPAAYVALHLDQLNVGSAYSADRMGGSNTQYRFEISPASLGLNRDGFLIDPGDPWHGVVAEVYTPDYFLALTLEDTLGPARVEMPADVTLWEPAPYSTFYTDESGVLPPGTMIQLAVEAIQYEWECEWVASPSYAKGSPNCADVAQQVDEVQFYVDDQLVHTSTSPVVNFNHTYDWNASGLPVGTHTVKAVAIASDGSEHHSQVNSLIVEEGEPSLSVSRTVTRHGNYFEVELTLSVDPGASGGVYLDYLQDYANELMPVRKSELGYRVFSRYPAWPGSGARLAKITVDFRTSSSDLVYLAPGSSLVATYDLVPILYEDGQADPKIGSVDLLVRYKRNNITLERSFAFPWQSLPSVQDALNASDYILVTNPTRLHCLYAQDEVYDLLGTMAHLATIRNGVLGFLDTYVGTYANADSDDILQVLTRSGGYWAEALNPAFKSTLGGYMLIVGETEVVPAWDSHNFDICWSIPGDSFHCRVGDNDVYHHDQWYSDTGGDGKPELIVGRIIGNSAEKLESPLRASIGVYEGLSNYHYQAPGRALLVSGRGRGEGSFEFNVEVISWALDEDWVVDVLNLPDTDPDVALQNGLANGISLLHLMGHGNIDSWGGGGGVPSALVTSSPPNLDQYRPFVFAPSCLTGDYEKGDDYNLAESLFDQGTAVYVGATQVSPVEKNTEISANFYGSKWQWADGETLGHAYAQLERAWYNESAYYDWYRFWVVEYNFYGDPKFGASEPTSTALAAPAATTAPTTTLHIQVPDYVISTTVDGFDLVDIPGGKVLMEEGLHRVPYWSVSVDYTPGYRIQDVDLTLRSGQLLTTGLILPTTVITYYTSASSSGGTTQTLSLTEDDDWFPHLDDIYDWQVSLNPDGSSQLNIQLFPFHYQPATTNAEWYSDFDFDIDVISTTVGVEAFTVNAKTLVPGDSIGADLWLDNSGAPLDVIVAPTVRDLVNGDTVDGLDLHLLHALSGPSTYGFEWDSSGFAPGHYLLWVDLLDSEGNWLDSASETFRLGITAAEITAFSATPDFFRPGEPIDISVVINNTGSAPLSGEAIIQVQTASGMTTTAVFTHPVTSLAPGAELAFNDVWDTTDATEKDYRVLGYVKHDSRASEVEAVNLTTRRRIYLPLIARFSP
jgi:hypothetical protein